ncbi:ribosomal protein S5 domain 2-like protein [Daedalea quercina L-15889]|uniref:Ribosomal protein S5 domain 2-like protein n=1 Tax=Daedalea quercina L-15889 TaxID=1314783 RepID=A0A165QLN8_9APHY|nr:ribosomal protein S5 domain 2-like protein [Daedalea quercina L-15889]
MSRQKDHTLNSFLGLPLSQANFECIATSQEIRDRGSTFAAKIYAAASVKDAHAVHAHVKNTVHGAKPATHEVAAWRCMVLKPGKTGLGGPDDFELRTGSVDDGEQHAGGRVLKVLQDEGVLDAVVVVSRWYGGVMLGPVRFAHFETCAREVCRKFRLKDDMDNVIATLTSLDDILASLRADLAKLTASTPDVPSMSATATTAKKAPNYDSLKESLDTGRAKRLITARENAIRSVKAALKKHQEVDVKD